MLKAALRKGGVGGTFLVMALSLQGLRAEWLPNEDPKGGSCGGGKGRGIAPHVFSFLQQIFSGKALIDHRLNSRLTSTRGLGNLSFM